MAGTTLLVESSRWFSTGPVLPQEDPISPTSSCGPSWMASSAAVRQRAGSRLTPARGEGAAGHGAGSEGRTCRAHRALLHEPRPATFKDYLRWSTLTAADGRQGLDMVGSLLQREAVDGRTYWFAPSESGTMPPSPTVDLVQGYDECIMSYSESKDLLRREQTRGPHAKGRGRVHPRNPARRTPHRPLASCGEKGRRDD